MGAATAFAVAFGLTAVTFLSLAEIAASFAVSGWTGAVSARDQLGSLCERVVGVGDAGVEAVSLGRVAAIAGARAVVRANVDGFAFGFDASVWIGVAEGGVGTVWRTSASSFVSDWSGVC